MSRKIHTNSKPINSESQSSLALKELSEYSKAAREITTRAIDKEIKKAKEFGPVQVQMLESFKNFISLGKGVRGFFILLMYKACGGKEIKKITNASTYIEYFHSSVLIQDDFMDRDDFRRGIPALHKEIELIGKKLKVKCPYDHFGNAMAVCLSDFGMYMSWEVLLSSSFDPKILLTVSAIYSNYIKRLSLGQSVDLMISAMDKAKEKDILKVLMNKSGEYTAILPMLSGATFAGCKNKKVLKAIENYGRCFGWAFQIQDDLLGAFGDEKELGKPIGSDFSEGKNTLLILKLKQLGTKNQLSVLARILGKKDITNKEVSEMRRAIEESGARKYVYNLGWKYVNEGKKYIPLITKDKKIRKILESLLVFVMERTK